MPDLLQTSLPVLPKNYVNPTSKTTIQNDEIFDLVDLSKVIKTSERSEQTKQDNASYDGSNIASPKMPMLISKDPSYAASSLRVLLSGETIAQIKNSGNEELAAKLTEFANELMLSPDDVVSDLIKQQDTLSLFKGGFFDLLRQITAQTSNTELKNSIALLLKSISSSVSSKEILNSISLNLNFLSQEMAANRTLSESLAQLSRSFASENAFENFPSLKNQALGLLGNVSQSLLMNDKIKNSIPLIIYNLSRFQSSPAAVSDSFRGLMEFISSQQVKDSLMKSFADFVENSSMPADIKGALLLNSPSAAEEKQLAQLLKNLIQSSNSYCENMNPDILKNALSSLDNSNGIDSVKNILSLVIPQEADSMVQQLLKDFDSNHDLNRLISKLSSLLDGINRTDIKIPLTQSLNEALNRLAAKHGTEYSSPSSMDNLASFLSKNINDSALRSMNVFSRQTAIQSMLTAPGVFTPLSHFLVPLQYENSRAFGELWVDGNAGGGSAQESDENHIFLSFSIENIGDFELEIFAKNTDLSINLLCPEDFAGSFSKIKDHIVRIAAVSGYSPKEMRIGALKEKRNIIDVFPRIKEKRAGLNVTI